MNDRQNLTQLTLDYQQGSDIFFFIPQYQLDTLFSTFLSCILASLRHPLYSFYLWFITELHSALVLSEYWHPWSLTFSFQWDTQFDQYHLILRGIWRYQNGFHLVYRLLHQFFSLHNSPNFFSYLKSFAAWILKVGNMIPHGQIHNHCYLLKLETSLYIQ